MDSFSRLEPEYAETFQAWKATPSKQSLGALLRQVQPAIDKGIVAHVGEPNPILRGTARKLAIGAIQSYDPAQARLTTHIVNQLQSLRRAQRSQQNILHTPERVTLDQRYLQTASAELEDQLGREPTTSELADHTGLSMKRISHVRRYTPAMAEGSLQSVDEDGDSQSYSPAVERSNEAYTLRAAYDDLDDINQAIMEWTLGLHGKPRLSNQRIAAKLRMTPGAVSQRKAAIQKHIDLLRSLE